MDLVSRREHSEFSGGCHGSACQRTDPRATMKLVIRRSTHDAGPEREITDVSRVPPLTQPLPSGIRHGVLDLDMLTASMPTQRIDSLGSADRRVSVEVPAGIQFRPLVYLD